MARPSNDADTRPTVEELQRRYLAFAEVIAAEEDDEQKDQNKKLHDQIIKKFKLGVRKVCAPGLWKEIQSAVGVATKKALARRFGFHPSIVSNGYSHGALSLENLLVMLSEIREEFGLFKKLPSRDERAVSGYSEAARFLRTREIKRGPKTKLSRASFFTLKALHENGRWLKLTVQVEHGRADDDARETLERLTRQILASAERNAGGPLPYSTTNHLRTLRHEWGDSFWTCYNAIAFRWIEDGHE